MKRSLNHPHHQRGAVLLLSVLILASLTAVAGGVAALLYTDLRSNRNVDEGIQAYYQAESGLESGLNTVRQNRNSGFCSNATTASTTICQQDTDCTTLGSDYTCKYRTFAQTLTDIMVPLPRITSRVVATGVSRQGISELRKDQSVQLNVYDSSHELLSDFMKIRSISFTGSSTPTDNAWLEVTWSGWLSDGTYFDHTTKRLLSSCFFNREVVCYGETKINLRDTVPDSPEMVAFQVTVKAIFGDVSNIQVKMYQSDDIGGQEVSPPSSISLKSIGTVGSAQTALSAVVPWRLPASGLFDFVLFSEETIKKE